MLHQNEEKSKQEKEGQQRFMGAMKTLGIAALLWQNSIRKESRKYGKEKDGSRRSAYELFKTLLLLVFDMRLRRGRNRDGFAARERRGCFGAMRRDGEKDGSDPISTRRHFAERLDGTGKM